MEGVQRITANIIPVLKYLMCEQRLEKMKLPSMCYRRLRGDLIEVFKCTHNIYKHSDSLLELDSRTNTRVTNYATLQQHLFTQRLVDIWNSLPAEVAEAPSLNAFNNRVDLFMREYMYSLEEPLTTIRSGNWQSEH